MDACYSMGNRATVENAAFYGGEPIWVTAEKQGIRTASYFWVGSEAPVMGIYPSIWKRYEPDSKGHELGPDNPQLVEVP